MAIVIDRDQGITSELEDRIGLECPYCGVYAHMQPQSVPEASSLLRDRPKHVGLVYKCDACNAPVFLRFAVREYQDNKVELYRNFVELERPKGALSVLLPAEAHRGVVPRSTGLLLEQQLQRVRVDVSARVRKRVPCAR